MDDCDEKEAIWKITAEEYREYASSLEEMKTIGLDPEGQVPQVKPDWYDEDLFKKGQDFAGKYILSVAIGQIMGLITLLSFKNSIQPLIFTRKSDSTETARARYMSTAMIVRSWYNSDLWDAKSQGYRNIQKVRKYHSNVSKIINSLSENEINQRCTLSSIMKTDEIKCPVFQEAKKVQISGMEFINQHIHEHSVYFNQAEMSLTLFGFMGYIVAFPHKFGVPEDEEGLAGFAHLWRVIGYMLGVQDKYNFCQGSYAEVKEGCRTMIKLLVRPNMQHLNDEWEHMSRCAVEGINRDLKGFSFDEILLFLFWTIDLDISNLILKLSWATRVKYYLLKCLLTYLYTFSLLRASINFNMNMMVEKYQRKLNKDI